MTKEERREYYHTHKEQFKGYRKKYNEANKGKMEEINAKRRETYKNNPGRIIRSRLTSAVNLLYKHGLIDTKLYAEIRGRLNENQT